MVNPLRFSNVLNAVVGRKASINEKRKGTEISTGLKSHRGGKPNIHTVDEGSEEPEFWDLLGGKGAIASAEEGGSDLELS